MKTIILFFLISFPLMASDNTTLIDALIQVESQGNDKAVGDKGKALGCLQIWDVVVQDVNRVYKTSYTHQDMYDRTKAKDVCEKYLSYWGSKYEAREGKKATNEVLSKIWNGGPKGYTKKATEGYWIKVKKELDK